MASRSANVFSTTSRVRSEHPPSPPWHSANRWHSPHRRKAVIATEGSIQMPLHLRPRLQRRGLLCKNLRDALRRKVHVDKAGRGVGDLVITGDLAVAKLHDRDALEHRARAVGLRQQRAIAEGIARIERL